MLLHPLVSDCRQRVQVDRGAAPYAPPSPSEHAVQRIASQTIRKVPPKVPPKRCTAALRCSTFPVYSLGETEVCARPNATVELTQPITHSGSSVFESSLQGTEKSHPIPKPVHCRTVGDQRSAPRARTWNLAGRPHAGGHATASVVTPDAKRHPMLGQGGGCLE